MCSQKFVFLLFVVYDDSDQTYVACQKSRLSVATNVGGEACISHHNILSCKMKFSIYLPPKRLYTMSGLIVKKFSSIFLGAQMAAAQHGIILRRSRLKPKG